MIKKVTRCLLILHITCLQATMDSEYITRGKDFAKEGKQEKAALEFQHALSCNPRNYEAHFHLANIFLARNELNEAIMHYEKARQLRVDIPQIHYNLGIALEKNNNPHQALASFSQAVDIDPRYTKARNRLASLLKKEKKSEKLLELYRHTIDLEPENVSILRELSQLYAQQEAYEQALSYMEQAAKLSPHDIAILFEYGLALTRLGKIDKAIQAYQAILSVSPNHLQAMYNSAYVLKMAGRIDEALAYYHQVLTLDPTYEPAQFALGHTYLHKGDFDKGWQQHERYLKKAGKNSDKLRTFIRDNTVAGKTIFLVPEGGLGDTIQFVRYAQVLKEMGARVIVAAQKPLLNLLSRCDYIDFLISTDQGVPKHYDDHGTLMSMPAIFNSNEETIPRTIPYIHPDPTLVHSWASYFESDRNFKIGICWQADIHNDSSRLPVARRGIPLNQFFPLSQLKNVSLYSLQKREGLEQLHGLPDNVELSLFDDSFDSKHGSFMDTAAVMQHLDLVITVDTAIGHLAGSMGRPVWLLLPYSTDWRWIAGRNDTPWYPSMRIFKQSQPFDWESAMRQVYWELATIVQQRK